MYVVRALLFCLAAQLLMGLDPAKALSQYSRAIWTQQQGLPQDRVRAITQTPDGFLWLGTDDGLVRFDGYEFVTYNKERDKLPSNSVGSLAAGKDGSLWLGTPKGLVQRTNKTFRTLTTADGLPADNIETLFVDSQGVLWVVAGGVLSKHDGNRFTNYLPDRDLGMTKARAVAEDRDHNIYVVGWHGVAKFEGGRFKTIVTEETLRSSFPISFSVDQNGTIWILGTRGVTGVLDNKVIRHFGPAEAGRQAFGLTGTVRHDRHGNIWVGSQGSISRLRGVADAKPDESDEWGAAEAIFEDRDGNLWLGTHSGLVRLHDDLFTTFGKIEGFPKEPQAILQDKLGRTWVGYRDHGLFQFPSRTPPTGAPMGGVFSVQEGVAGEILVAGREGLSVYKENRWRTYVPPDPLGRKSVYDSLRDSRGRTWVVLPGGLGWLDGDRIRYVPEASAETNGKMFMILAEDREGALWAGSIMDGLLRIKNSEHRWYTLADGLLSQQISCIFPSNDGTLWVGAVGGGLSRLRDGKFESFTERDGLPSDNVLNIVERGDELWLSSTSGISQLSKQELEDLSQHKISRLHPVSHGAAGGLRSTVGLPRSVGGTHADGSLWFLTNKGVAVYRPTTGGGLQPTLPVYLTEVEASGKQLDFDQASTVPPGDGRLHIRYGALYLSAPDLVDYSYKLDGLDSRWVHAGRRRGVNYDNLRPGHYQFTLRADLPGVTGNERSFEFDVLPRFYQTLWFQGLMIALAVGVALALYRIRVRQLQTSFAAVLEERGRLAREIHDTLAQAFVGISSQLDVMEMRLPEEAVPARRSLDLARRMTQHSLTEARRAVSDLRTAALDEQDIVGALRSSAELWAEDGGADIAVDVEGKQDVSRDVGHHVLRIAQEAISNSLKHAGANRVSLWFRIDGGKLHLRVTDDGCGFEPREAFASSNGHFGLIGMRERADRVGGELRVESSRGDGTQLDLVVPL